MKKIGIFLVIVLLITGCGKKSKSSIINDFKNKVNKSKSYEIVGTMDIINDEDVFKYDVNVKYLHKDNDYYKVVLKNQTNNHEQVILKNAEGVYVVTPSLNKSFKFQSNWPNNSSQSYLLSSIVNDIKNDSESNYEEKDGYYIIKNKVKYPNNEELVYEKIYLDKDMLPKKVEVYNDKDVVKIKVEFNKIDLKAGVDEDEFELSKLVKEPECDLECQNAKKNSKKEDSKNNNTAENNEDSNDNVENDIENKKNEEINEQNQEEETEDSESQNTDINKTEEKSTTSIQDIIYPLYVPENTSLKSKDVISTENGERVILTFSGENSFVLVEETLNISDEFEIIPVYGDPEIVNDSIGALSANSLSWTSNNINYYITGANLARNDLLSIATSMNNTGVVNAEK
ncbi:MAG: outer membrane lipoprotein carrier protein LolA [Firmicutes bacterium]|nr:outer membrane lipoprotein carrier protein LolA [Bacillota bacterium]